MGHFKSQFSIIFGATILLCFTPWVKSISNDWLETGDTGQYMTGQWTPVPSNCPAASFITGYSVRTNRDGEIRSMSFQCSIINSTTQFFMKSQIIRIGASPSSQPQAANELEEVDLVMSTYAVGFAMQRWKDESNEEFVGGRVLRFKGQEIESTFPNGTHSIELDQVLCARGWGICGAHARMESSRSVVTRLRFRCCYFCVPRESETVVYDYKNRGASGDTFQLKKTFGARFEKGWTSSNHVDWNRNFETDSNVGHTSQRNWGHTSSLSTNSMVGSSLGKNSGWDLRLGSSVQTGSTVSEDLGVRASTNLGKSKNTGSSSDKGNSAGGSVVDSTQKALTTSKTKNSNSNKKKCASISGGHSKTNVRGSSNSQHESQTDEVSASVGVSAFGFSASVSASTSSTTGSTQSEHEETQETKNSGFENSDCTEEGSIVGAGAETRVGTDKSTSINWGTESRLQESYGESWAKNIEKSLDQREQKSRTNQSEQNINRGTQGGTSETTESSLTKGQVLAVEKAIQHGAQASFSKKDGGSSSKGFNWGTTTSSMWHEETEELQTFTCDPMTHCVIKQTVGTCGVLQIKTTKFDKTLTPLRTEDIQEPTPLPADPFDFRRPDEMWIVVRNLSFFEPSGEWTHNEICPPDGVVTGHQFKSKLRLALTGINLICSKLEDQIELQNEPLEEQNILSVMKSPEGKAGRWSPVFRPPSTFAVGYRFIRSEIRGVKWLGNQELMYKGIQRQALPRWASNSSLVEIECPADHGLCGVASMTDKTGRGVLTGLAFKCCHACVPETQLVTRQSYENRSPSSVSHTIKTIVGTQTTKNVGESSASNSGHSVDGDGTILRGIRAGFSARFGNTSSSSFDWSKSQNSMWTEQVEKTYDFVCEPMSLCAYKQLVGICGEREIATPHAVQVSIPLDDLVDNDVSEKERNEPKCYFERGQLWIEIQIDPLKLQGVWTKSAQSCPYGSVVTSYQVGFDVKVGLQKLVLFCFGWNGTESLTHVKTIFADVNTGQNDKNFETLQNGQTAAHPVVGVSFSIEEHETGNRLGNFEMIEDQGQSDTLLPAAATAKDVTCPSGYAVCGIQAQIDEKDKDSITRLRLRCCYHCEPREELVMLDAVTNSGTNVQDVKLSHVTVGNVADNGSLWSNLVAKGIPMSDQLSDFVHKENPLSLMALFSQRIGKAGIVSGFSWKRLSRDTWFGRVTRSREYKCDPGHFCQYEQLIGVCGDYRVASPHMKQESVPSIDPVL